MSVGLDALNKLQRERAEQAAVAAPGHFQPFADSKPQTNRVLAIGFVLSLGIAIFALYRSRGNGSAHSSPASPASAESAVLAASAGPLTPAATTTLTFDNGVQDGRSAAAKAAAQRTNALVTDFVTSGKIGGVEMGTGPNATPEVMFNDSLYHQNDVVNPILGVRLIRVLPHFLVFQDAQGVLYEKPVPGHSPLPE